MRSKAFSPAAKVGLVSLLGLALSVAALGWLTQFRLQSKGYQLHVVYSDVNGLLPGASVLLMGVRIGKVVKVLPGNRTVDVSIELPDPSLRLLRGSKFKILTKGIVGEKNLEIFPPPAGTEALLAPGESVRGDDPPRLEFALEKANETIASFQKMSKSSGLTNLTKRLNRMMGRFEGTFDEVNLLALHLDELVRQTTGVVGKTSQLAGSISPEDVRQLTGDLKALSKGFRRTYEDVIGAPENVDNTRQILSNVRNLSDRLENMASGLEKFVENPQTKKDLDDVVQSSRSVISLVGRNRNEHDEIPLSPNLAIAAVNEKNANLLVSNFGLQLNFPTSFFRAGLEELGEANLWNFIWGRPKLFGDRTGYHLGMIRSKIGGGIDFAPDRTLSLTGQIFDPLKPELRLGLTYFPEGLERKYGIFGQWQRALMSGDARMVFGVQWRPLD